jgi:hypothetical protein
MLMLTDNPELKRAEVCNVEAFVLDYGCHHHQYRAKQAAFRKKWGLSYQEALYAPSLEDLAARIA